MSETVVPRVRARQHSPRVLRNDERLLDASMSVMAEDGWAGISFLRVSERAGLSRRTLQSRFRGPSDLMAAMWTRRAWPLLRDLLQGAITAAGLEGTAGTESPDPVRLSPIMHSACAPSPDLRAAIELLIVAHFDGPLRDSVSSSFGDWAARQFTVSDSTSATRAAQRAVVTSTILGLLVTASRPGSESLNLSEEAERLALALASPTTPAELPGGRFTHLDEPVPFDTGDVTTDQLLQATLDLIGASGFEATSTDAIAERAGVSQGALFARYATKLDLVTDAIARQNALAFRLNAVELERIAADRGHGFDDAVMIRETQRPEREHLRAIALESLRVGWHSPVVGAAASAELEDFSVEFLKSAPTTSPAFLHVGYAIGTGVLLMPLVFPECAALPYDTVMVSLAKA